MTSIPNAVIPCSVKVESSVLTQSARANMTFTVDTGEMGTLVITVPGLGLRVSVFTSGANTDTFTRCVTGARGSDTDTPGRLASPIHSDSEARHRLDTTNENAPFGPRLAAVEGTFSTAKV